jgi:hypothetical protein
LFGRYARLAAEVDRRGGEIYECVMTGGVGKRERMRPQMSLMLLIAKRLESMEDRLGLSPAARMQYLQRVQTAGAQASLPGMAEPSAQPTSETTAPVLDSPVGMLNANRNALN